jgi:hypothetical protein
MNHCRLVVLTDGTEGRATQPKSMGHSVFLARRAFAEAPAQPDLPAPL